MAILVNGDSSLPDLLLVVLCLWLAVLLGSGGDGNGPSHILGLYLVNFVFFIGISHAGTLISAILRITHAGWRTPITRAAEVVTVFALAAGPTNILFDLGRSIRFYWVAIHAQFKSPLLWDFTCIMTYFVTSVLSSMCS